MRLAGLCVVILILLTSSAGAGADPINAVIGDRSWTGPSPADEAPEDLRIRTHLAYVRERLGRVTTDLPPTQLARRTALLHALEAYIARGLFPRRTGDPFTGRRPRFIDDRGVHCAVAHLIATSGAPALARAINERYEYALVHQMDSPALRAWATTNGFTIDELAMIQPGYDALPDEHLTRQRIARATNAITLGCATLHAPTATVTLRVVGDKRGRATATTDSTDPFDRCFAASASQLETGSGTYDRSPEPYQFGVSVTIPNPQALLDKRVAALEVDRDCTPRPGAIPAAATYDVTGDRDALHVHVTTTPANPATASCLEASAREQLRAFSHVANLHATRRVRLQSRLEPRSLHPVVESYAGIVMAGCYPETDDALPATVTVRLTAKRDAPRFTITDDSGHPSFSTCVRDQLDPTLRDVLAAYIDEAPGRYFRIDTNVDTSVAITIDMAAVRSEREYRERKRRERRVRE